MTERIASSRYDSSHAVDDAGRAAGGRFSSTSADVTTVEERFDQRQAGPYIMIDNGWYESRHSYESVSLACPNAPACRILSQPRSSQRRLRQPRDDEPALLKRIHELVRQRPRFGYRRIAALLWAEGRQASAARILRLWRQEGLKVPQKKRKRRRLGQSANGLNHRRATAKDHSWTWDFVFDGTTAGSPLKWLSIVDEYTRECLALKVDRSLASEDVIETLAELLAMRGVPQHLRSDNGPEFIALAVQRWLAQVGVETLYVEPGSPWENGYVESFHRRLRDEFLAVEEFGQFGRSAEAHRGLEGRLQPPPAAWLAGAPRPGRVRRSLHRFRSGEGFGYASARSSAPAVQRSPLTQTFIATGTGI